MIYLFYFLEQVLLIRGLAYDSVLERIRGMISNVEFYQNPGNRLKTVNGKGGMSEIEERKAKNENSNSLKAVPLLPFFAFVFRFLRFRTLTAVNKTVYFDRKTSTFPLVG
jgi:hypothetical protein